MLQIRENNWIKDTQQQGKSTTLSVQPLNVSAYWPARTSFWYFRLFPGRYIFGVSRGVAKTRRLGRQRNGWLHQTVCCKFQESFIFRPPIEGSCFPSAFEELPPLNYRYYEIFYSSHWQSRCWLAMFLEYVIDLIHNFRIQACSNIGTGNSELPLTARSNGASWYMSISSQRKNHVFLTSRADRSLGMFASHKWPLYFALQACNWKNTRYSHRKVI